MANVRWSVRSAKCLFARAPTCRVSCSSALPLRSGLSIITVARFGGPLFTRQQRFPRWRLRPCRKAPTPPPRPPAHTVGSSRTDLIAKPMSATGPGLIVDALRQLNQAMTGGWHGLNPQVPLKVHGQLHGLIHCRCLHAALLPAMRKTRALRVRKAARASARGIGRQTATWCISGTDVAKGRDEPT